MQYKTKRFLALTGAQEIQMGVQIVFNQLKHLLSFIFLAQGYLKQTFSKLYS